MSSASSLPYQLRPNKAVDRELFLSLLARLSGSLNLEEYTYVGLGGPFLEDFRLVHSRLGIAKMICVESEEAVHKRQVFNQPIPSVECKHNTLEKFIDSTEFDNPVIIWFDYTDPKAVTKQIIRFAETAMSVPLNSILRITLNAQPGSLGVPDADEIQTPPDGEKDEDDHRPTLYEWRLAKFRDRMGKLFPSETAAADMDRTRYGRALLMALKLAVSNELLSYPQRTVSWVLATHYADGQQMTTATLLVLPNDSSLGELVKKWPFHSSPEAPLLLDMPVISTRERLTLEAHGGKSAEMNYDFPISKLGEDPIESFKRFYRVFPHFSRVDL
jgi:hypothetical protein